MATLLVALILSGGAVMLDIAMQTAADNAARSAGETVVNQLGGDVQAAFDPASLRPSRNPGGSEYLVFGAQGQPVTTSDLPLRVDPGDVMLAEDGVVLGESLDGYVASWLTVAAADGSSYVVVALTPTAVVDTVIGKLRTAVIAMVLVGTILIASVIYGVVR